MNTGSVTAEARLVWALQYVTPFENWLKARLLGFCRRKFHNTAQLVEGMRIARKCLFQKWQWRKKI